MEQPIQFGGFLLFRKSGSNAYRTSYRAGVSRGRAIDRVVRLEVFDGPEIDAAKMLARLEASRGLQERIRDPHIARGVGVGEVAGVPYAAYDFQLGVTLDTFVNMAREQSFPVPLDQALFIAERIALALAAAHGLDQDTAAVLHSFLTPDSVMLSNEGGVKVLGFETSAALRDQFAQSPAYESYLSPECRSGEAACSQDDVYSLGSILFALVSGHPHPGDGVNLKELTVQATGETVSQSLRHLLEGSFSPRADRIPSVLEWQQALGRLILNGEYNPTTFNLAFLMHTIMRDRLEQDGQDLKQEKQFLLTREAESELAAEKTPAFSRPVSETDELPMPDRPVEDEKGSLSSVSIATADLTEDGSTSGGRPFWFGFILSAIAGGLVLGALMLVGSKQSNEPLTPEPLASATRPDPARPDSGRRTDPSPTPLESPETATQEADTEDVVRTEIVNGELGAPPSIDELELERLVSERTRQIERDLEAEYQRKIDSVRAEAIENAQKTVVDAPSPTGAAEPIVPQQTASAGTDGIPSVPGALPSGDEPGIAASGESPVARLAAPAEPPTAGSLEPTAGPGRSASEPTKPEPLEATPVSSPSPQQTRTGADGSARNTPLRTNDSSPPSTQPSSQTSDPPEQATPSISPRLLRLGTQTYPPIASRLGLSARVRVRVHIGTDGRVTEAEVIGPEVGHGFDAAALATVRRSRWAPATHSGEPVEAWTSVTIEFKP